ncbi:MAG: 16S rRNA (guanine(527)-N(7))-methyltransferase RsmG [Erysipelotrichia bacterium]|nr:16S rRNA (guanine(527)-N(7))-methyltransferase RsmG [Erysipelotrichia bacterium]
MRKDLYNSAMTKEQFLEILAQNGLELSRKQMDQLCTYASFLKEYNEKINLTAITDFNEVLDKHFLDSLLLSFDKKMEGTIVDVGTGAGFPGVVLKICYPDLKVILIEPLMKRCIFLNELISKLDLKDIEVINARGEDYSLAHREAYDFVTARAVSNLNALIEVCGAMVKKDGYFIALRGLNGETEIENAHNAIKQMGFECENVVKHSLNDGSLRVIGYLRKVALTPKKLPRKYSIIKQRPL